MKCVWMDMSFWPLINGSERAWVLSNAFSFLVLSPLWAAFAFPWQDRAGSQHRCDVQQTISFFFFALLFYLHSLRSQGAAPVRWRDEVGRAGTRVGRRVDKKAAVLFHLCLFFSPSHFPSSVSQVFLRLSWFLVLQGQGLYSAAIGVGLRFLSDSLV